MYSQMVTGGKVCTNTGQGAYLFLEGNCSGFKNCVLGNVIVLDLLNWKPGASCVRRLFVSSRNNKVLTLVECSKSK